MKAKMAPSLARERTLEQPLISDASQCSLAVLFWGVYGEVEHIQSCLCSLWLTLAFPFSCVCVCVCVQNAASGVAVNPACMEVFEKVRSRKLRYVIYKIDAAKGEVNVLETQETGTYDEFVAKLPEDDARYAAFDYDFESSDGCPISKIFFIMWTPDSAKIKAKMLYAASKDKFKRELNGVQYELQACDLDDVDEAAIRAKCA